MILLDGGMSLITPEPGILFWTTLIFLLLWFILGKYAFRPIANALKDRESSITEALESAEKAKAEMASLQADNERIVREANDEKNRILNEARDTSQRMINEAKDKAKVEANKIVEDATVEIQTQKVAAIAEVKNMIGLETISLAEKVLGKELSDRPAQEAFVTDEVTKINLN